MAKQQQPQQQPAQQDNTSPMKYVPFSMILAELFDLHAKELAAGQPTPEDEESTTRARLDRQDRIKTLLRYTDSVVSGVYENV